jgi:putative endopeptidase
MQKLTLICGAAMFAFHAGGTAAEPTQPAHYGSWGFDLSGEDSKIKPGDNFYQYANGTYVKNLVIPPDQTRYGTFMALRDLSEVRTHDILVKAAATAPETPTDAIGKSGAFYKAFMDEKGAQVLGAKPLQPGLVAIRSVKDAEGFARLIGSAPKSLQSSLVDLAIQPDAKDPTQYAIYLSQSGLGMPDRDYYLTPQFADKRAKYVDYATHALQAVAWPEAAAAAKSVIDFEQEIATASWSRADSRDDDKTYNPISLADLVKSAPGFDWTAFFASADLGGQNRFILGQNTAIVKIAAIIGATPIDTLRAWAALHLIINASPYLSSDFVDADFMFFNKTLQGQPQNRPRWKRAVRATEAALGDAIGQAYVAAYYPPEARAKMEVLTGGLREAFKRHLEHNDWMSPATKAKALEKLSTFDFQIGYPKKWRDYSGLTIRANDMYGNVARGTAFDWAFQTGHLGKPVDRDQWEMYPQTVNAYNEPLLNEVVFPAAILQPPFFNAEADPAVNYGAIGGVIGHEMTHSFDDQGRKHDAHGRLNNWWTKEDEARFEEKAKKFGAQYAAMDIMPGAHINPDLTMGENIADLGGLTMALDAYHASLHGKKAPVIDGLTGDQRVFLGWAQVWRLKVRDDAARQLLVIDPHSPSVARTNGPMRNVDAWYSAFDVKPGDKLYLAPADRVKIW